MQGTLKNKQRQSQKNPAEHTHTQQMENRTKTTAQTLSAFLMLLSGVALNVASFAVPPVGELSNSVMTYMGEALIYAASVFGLTVYVNSCMARLERRVGKDARQDDRQDDTQGWTEDEKGNAHS